MKKINIRGQVYKNKPLKEYTSFKIGGPADILALPQSKEDLCHLIDFCRHENLPRTILGEGANVLISDKGIEGMVILTSQLCKIKIQDEGHITAQAGASMSRVVEIAQKAQLSGLEFIYAMPGSVGGSVYMNARCYDISVSEIIDWVESIDAKGNILRHNHSPEDFDYKKSPYQSNQQIIFQACFKTKHGAPEKILEAMMEYKNDRIQKGHFQYPSAGSTFKNNRAFGQSTGRIIDSLGLKGFSRGDAQISPYHANIFINTGQATATDMRLLIEEVQTKVKSHFGFNLEPEVIYLGRW